MNTAIRSIDTARAAERNGMAASAGLAGVLADTALLALKTQNYHWNVTGPDFFSLHGLFEAQYEELAEATDELAERIRALGFPAPGSFREFLTLGTVEEAKSGTTAAADMVRDLADGHQAVVRTAKRALPSAEADDDQATADMLVARIAAHEKAAWMLESTLQS